MTAVAEMKVKEEAETNRRVRVAEVSQNKIDYTFEGCYQKVMEHEGGYVKDPRDPGGETFRGVSRKNFPNWEGWVILDKIKKEKFSELIAITKDYEKKKAKLSKEKFKPIKEKRRELSKNLRCRTQQKPGIT